MLSHLQPRQFNSFGTPFILQLAILQQIKDKHLVVPGKIAAPVLISTEMLHSMDADAQKEILPLTVKTALMVMATGQDNGLIMTRSDALTLLYCMPSILICKFGYAADSWPE